MKRTIYLNMCAREEARNLLFSRFSTYRTGNERIAARSSCGRVLIEPVYARFSSPSFHAAAMDGLAVKAEETFAAADHNPVALRLDTGQAVMINTGYPLPSDKNAVVMIENVVIGEDGTTGVIRAPVYPWQHVRKVGEDIVATELLFPSGHQVRPADIAALISGGCGEVIVRKRPRLAIIPTGSELVDLEDLAGDLPAGRTIESNSAALAGIAEQAGSIAEVHPIVKDDYETIKNYLATVVQGDADMVVINAGSSAGTADYSVRVIEELGEVFVHGVTMMPGKPTILGVIGNKPVIGVPGYAVSAILAMEQFVAPLLAMMQGVVLPTRQTVPVILARDLPSRGGFEEFRRIIVGRIGERFVGVPLKKGAGALTSLTKANAMLCIAAQSEGALGGKEMAVELLAPIAEVERTIICTGSHDLSLDIINDRLRRQEPSYTLASSHVGSFGGILAVKQGMCHLAGSHLLDPKDGTYNVAALRKSLPGRKIRLVTLVHREQGFIVPRNNPKGISAIQDLLRDDVCFINRQPGSGTRVLLDYELERNGLDGDDIKGYEDVEYTHMAVAVAVLSGKVDAGLGIRSAARALGLGFVPLIEERYDVIIPAELFDSPMIQAILALINTAEFRQEVEALGGYSTRETGMEVKLS